MADLSLNHSLAIPEDVVFRVLDDEAVVLNLKSGVYFGLDPVGTRVWQLVAEHRSLERVLGVLVEEYDVDRATLERDLLELGRRMQAKGLVTVVE